MISVLEILALAKPSPVVPFPWLMPPRFVRCGAGLNIDAGVGQNGGASGVFAVARSRDRQKGDGKGHEALFRSGFLHPDRSTVQASCRNGDPVFGGSLRPGAVEERSSKRPIRG